MTKTPQHELAEAVVRELNPPMSFDIEQLIEWQRKLRAAVDNHIAAHLSQPITAEFERRYNESPDDRASLVKWANEVLKRTQLHFVCESTQKPSFLCFNRVRESDAGRINYHPLGLPRRRTVMLKPPFSIQLVGESAIESWQDRTILDKESEGAGPSAER